MKHKAYSGNEIKEILAADIVAGQPEGVLIEDVLIDSRRLVSVRNCLFFALVSKHNDGHKYITELYKKGIRNFVVSNPSASLLKLKDATLFKVDNTLTALQQLVAAHRENYNIPVVGITGSNGKTVVKEWIFQLLFKDKKIIRSPKSYNSQIGVPLSVWQINSEHQLGVFEAGISEPEEMLNLQKIIKPNIGIFTNIGDAHSENFINRQQKVGEKLKLFTHVETLIYCADQKEVQEIVFKSGILNGIKKFSWGKQSECNLIIEDTMRLESQTEIKAVYEEKKISITIPFTDSASIENAIHCWSLMLLLGYENEMIKSRMLLLSAIAMRLEIKEGTNNCTLINDTYNSDFNSLSIALDLLLQQNSSGVKGRKTSLILSDILQSGKNDVELYTEVSQLIKNKGVDNFIGIGPSLSAQSGRFDEDAVFFNSTSEFLNNYSFASFANQLVLLKGARVFEFERISRRLQQKLHETVLEINFSALAENLNYFRKKLNKGTKIMAMVKAFSYGSGGFEIANLLEFHNIDYLGVAYADEGVDLRRAGVKMPIMVMSPEEHSFDTMIKHNLEPEIYSLRALSLLEKAIDQNSLPQNKPVKVHLKIETGMNRLGFRDEEIEELIKRIKNNSLILVQSVFSHLAASDKQEFDEFTNYQIDRFRSSANAICDAFPHKIDRHILNSSGISRFPHAHFDMVRLGIGLYGVAGAETDKNKLRNVTRLRSVISKINSIKKGESVGYNRNFFAETEMQIGVVSIGYADGLSRNLSNNGHLWVAGKPAPIVGDVCMDMCMIDLKGIDAKEGDDVIVFDENHRVCELAEAASTIPYEILSRISRRVKRVYFYD